MRKPEEFKAKAKENKIHHWPMGSCSICHSPTQFLFGEYEDGDVYFDGRCECTQYFGQPQLRDWQSVANHYNLQTNSEVIEKYDKYWGFDKEWTLEDKLKKFGELIEIGGGIEDGEDLFEVKIGKGFSGYHSPVLELLQLLEKELKRYTKIKYLRCVEDNLELTLSAGKVKGIDLDTGKIIMEDEGCGHPEAKEGYCKICDDNDTISKMGR